MKELQAFLKSQKILQIAPAAGDPWIANVLMACNTPHKIYFVGSKDTLYGKKLLEDSSLAFATAWHEENNHCNRKGIQGVGKAHFTTDHVEIEEGIRLHNKRYTEFAKRITPDWAKSDEHASGVWVIAPSYIKFWNDELYGDNGSKEFKDF